MKTIWKYELEPDDNGSVEVQMPVGSSVLSAGVQGSHLYIWAEVDDDKVLSRVHHFYVYGTGHHLSHDQPARFVNTVFMGPLVFHVYEVL